jgi:hypothetical protein
MKQNCQSAMKDRQDEQGDPGFSMNRQGRFYPSQASTDLK